MDNLLFYIVDVVLVILLVNGYINSKKVVLETRVGAKWLIPSIVLIFGFIGWFKYDGWFRIIQSVMFVFVAVMYYLLKSGLSEDGIVMMGKLIKYHDAKPISVNKNESCIIFKMKKRNAALYFDYDQLNDVQRFLKKKI